MAALHRIVGSGFGNPARPLRPTWREAFLDMIAMLLADAARFDVPLPRDPADIVAIIERLSPAGRHHGDVRRIVFDPAAALLDGLGRVDIA